MIFETTAELASALVRLEEDGFQEFARLYGPRLRGYFLKRGLTVANAESLAVSMVTDIALKAPQHYIERGGKFDAWVFTLARNGLADWRRHQPPPTESLVPHAAVEVLADVNVVEAVQAAISTLSAVDREILRRRDMENQEGYAQIAGDLKLDPRTARVRHLRALRKLEQLLIQDPRIQARIARSKEAGLKNQAPHE